MKAFLDASALIYLIEGAAPFGGRVRKRLASLVEMAGPVELAVARLSWLECRVAPARAGASEVLALYDEFFLRPDLRWIELSRDVVELATVIRISHGLHTPDALQAAACLQLGDDHLFLTGDKGFARVAGLKVEILT